MIEQQRLKAAYAAGVILLVAAGMIFGPTKNPYGKHFPVVIVPGLIVLGCLQWLLPTLRSRWRILGAGCTLSTGVLLVLLQGGLRKDFADYSTVFLFVVFLHGFLLWAFTSDIAGRIVLVAAHIAIGFVTLLGMDLRLRGIADQLSDSWLMTAFMLFWAPMIALAVWPAVAAFSGNVDIHALIDLIGAFGCIGFGLFDLGAVWHVSWARPSAFIVWFAALGTAAVLAKKFQVDD